MNPSNLTPFNNPSFKNQGQCASFVASHGKKQHNKGN